MEAQKISGKLLTKDGEVDASTITAPVVCYYFSAHWCPPCKKFTPNLAAFYNERNANGKKLEIIFVTSDRDEKSFKEYFAEMPWKCLDYSDRRTKEMLSSPMLFNVTGIPTLVLVDAMGR